MYNSWSGLISDLSIGGQAHGFLLFFNEIERIFKCNFYLRGDLRLLFEVIYVYTINYNYQTILGNNQSLMTHSLQKQPIDCWTINHYLNQQQGGNQKLYDYLQRCKDPLGNFQFRDSIKGEIFSSDQGFLPFDVNQSQFSAELLQSTEQQIFEEVNKRMVELCHLEKELNHSKMQVATLSSKLNELRSSIDHRLCKGAEREAGLIIEAAKIIQIKTSTEQIFQKIELTNLLSQDIATLTHENFIKKERMQKQLDKLANQSRSSLALRTRDELKQQIEALKGKVVAYEQKDGNNESSKQAIRQQQLIRCLSQRKQIQQQMIHEEFEKKQFFQLLGSFKATYKNVKQKNKKLKQQLQKKGLSLPLVLRNEAPHCP